MRPGQTTVRWPKSSQTFRAEFYAPLVGPPYDPGRPETADLIAFGGRRVWISRDFGTHWHSIPAGDSTDDLPGGTGAEALATCLAFASPERLYVGALLRNLADRSEVVGGRVFRFDLGVTTRFGFGPPS